MRGNRLNGTHLARQGKAVALAFAQLLREAGGPTAQVATRPRTRDLAVPGVSAHDQRELDVVVRGLPLFDGRFIILDATLRSSFSSAGAVRLGSHQRDGATFSVARQDKERAREEGLRRREAWKLHHGARLEGPLLSCHIGRQTTRRGTDGR